MATRFRALGIASTLLVVLSAVYFAQHAGGAAVFEEWLSVVRIEALDRGITEGTVNSALTGLEPDPRVIGFDRRQPEFVQTFEQYLTARVTRDKVEKGRGLLKDHRETLERIGSAYGVDARYLVAFWGLESSFGRYQGKYSVIRSLATLAHDERRSAFFREELFNALQILDEGHITAEQMLGGWAGAMGQNQFLPSSFLHYAQDFDGDGHKDIWRTNDDVWASIANYLKKNGWTAHQEWGMRVELPAGLNGELVKLKDEKPSSRCRALKTHTRKMRLTEWQALGVRSEGGGNLPELDYVASLIIPDGDQSYTFMAFPNFRTILSYNCANKYAVSVGLMADQLSI